METLLKKLKKIVANLLVKTTGKRVYIYIFS